MAERIEMKTNVKLKPTVFAIFGGSGDLTWRKLVPSCSPFPGKTAGYEIIIETGDNAIQLSGKFFNTSP